MNSTAICASVLAVALSGSAYSCRFFHRAKAAPPPPLVLPAPQQTAPAPPELPAPPPAPAPQPVPEIPGEKPPPQPPKTEPARRRPSPAPAAPQPVPTPQPAPATPAPPEPELGQVLTAQQHREYNRIIDLRIARARRNLKLISGKPLSEEQRATFLRVETFIRQAGEARKDDPVTARNLAERADLLAQDLVNSFR